MRTRLQGRSSRALLAGALLLAVGISALPARGEDEVPEPHRAAGSPTQWRLELRRYFTERGTEDEYSKTTLRVEAATGSVVSLIRVDAPFVDKKNGDPTTPGWGDAKIRLGFREVPVDGAAIRTWVEATFPTASPDTLGGGKYQGSGIAQVAWPVDVRPLGGAFATAKGELTAQVQGTFSFAGDEERKDVNNTKLDLGLRTTFHRTLSVGLKVKATIDWVQDGETGGVLEVYGWWAVSRRWRVTLTLGHGLWGEGVPGTYHQKLEFALRYAL